MQSATAVELPVTQEQTQNGGFPAFITIAAIALLASLGFAFIVSRRAGRAAANHGYVMFDGDEAGARSSL